MPLSSSLVSLEIYVARRHGVGRTPGRPFSCLPSLLIACRSLASSSWPQRSLRLQYLLLQEVDAADEALKPGIWAQRIARRIDGERHNPDITPRPSRPQPLQSFVF